MSWIFLQSFGEFVGFSEHEQRCDEEHEFESPVEFLLGWRKKLLAGKDR